MSEVPTGRRKRSSSGARTGKVVVNRTMSLDGFIAGPGDDMGFFSGHIPPEVMTEVAGRTGAMLVGRRTAEVGSRMAAEEPASQDYPFEGPSFLLTHRPTDPPDPSVRVLSGDIAAAIATALAAAGGKDLELLGADVAAQAFRAGLVDEVLVYVVPVILGDGVRFSAPGSQKVELEPISSTQAGAITVLRYRVRKPGPRT